MIPAMHQKFVDQALPKLRLDERVLGVAANGSWVSGKMDEFSDVDLVIVVRDENFSDVLRQGREIADSLGPLLSTFTGEHVGEPNIFICLYENPLLHVDLKFVSETQFHKRADNPVVLFDRQNTLANIISATLPTPLKVDLQWIEDRFWTWMHYGAVKIARGEFFEAINFVAFLRSTVLGPLLLQKSGKPPYGLRRVEEYCPESLPALRATLATADDPESCERALKATAKLYLDLRELLATSKLKRLRRTEMAAMQFLHDACVSARNKNIVQFRHP
ncbi:MAG: aminoglycoside 6-adenylyltransferase [Bdellovibrionota bacterium]